MPHCKHYVPFEVKCPSCFAEGMAREAARQKDHRPGNVDRLTASPVAVMLHNAHATPNPQQHVTDMDLKPPKLGRG